MADEPTIYTYGGLEILTKIFQSISMLINGGSGNIFHSLCVITASLGGIVIIAKAFFTQAADALFTKYLLPLLVIPGILLIPSQTVHIVDNFNGSQKTQKVDNVPLFLAVFTGIVSKFGHEITIAVESVMHGNNDVSYSETGMIFGADTAMDINKYRITNGDLEQNLKRFCKQCILYDVALGKYTVDELKKTTDLWNFLSENTSTVRMIPYTDPQDPNKPSSSNRSSEQNLVTCKNALNKMKGFFDKESDYYLKQAFAQNLPLSYQALTGMAAEAKDLISQQIMINFLSGEFNSSNFAKSRAHAQQQSMYLTLGSLASTSLVTMRIILEVLIYVSFIFIIPMSLLPGGIKFLLNWVWLAVWIQLWPSFYAVLHYVMQIVAHTKAAGIFVGLPESAKGLSFFTSVGLENLSHDIYALSGYLAASIPFISYALLQGGIGSFMHLASAMMTPAHSAATSAAIEQTSGNYSIANTSFGQTSYQNSNALQNNLAPSLSSGFVRMDNGSYQTMHSADGAILKQNQSELLSGFFSDNTISSSLQHSHQQALSTTLSEQESFTESISNHGRSMYDLSSHLSSSESFSSGLSGRDGASFQESANYLNNVAQSLGKQYNLSDRDAYDLVAAGSAGVTILGNGMTIGTNSSHGWMTDEMLNRAANLTQTRDFQEHYNNLQEFSNSSAYNSLTDEGKRYVEGFTQSIDQVRSSQESYQSAYNELNQISDCISNIENTSFSIRNSLNNEFMAWANEAYSCEGGYNYAIHSLQYGTADEKAALADGFVEFAVQQQIAHHEGYAHPTDIYQNSSVHTLDPVYETYSLQTGGREIAESAGLNEEAVTNLSNHLDSQHSDFLHQRNANKHITSNESQFNDARKLLLNEALQEANTRNSTAANVADPLKGLVDVIGFGAIKIKKDDWKIAQQFQMTDQPFFMVQDK